MGTQIQERVYQPGADQPAVSFFAITPANATPFPQGPVRAIRVGVAGDVTAVNSAGVAVLIPNCQVGELLQIMATGVNSTGTTASGLVGYL